MTDNKDELELLRKELEEQKEKNRILEEKLANIQSIENINYNDNNNNNDEESGERVLDPVVLEAAPLFEESKLLHEMDPAKRNRQYYWERVYYLIKRVKKLPYNPGFYMDTPEQLLVIMQTYRNEKGRISVKKLKSSYEFDPLQFSWDLDRLGKDICKTIFLQIDPDDGNWLNNLLVSKQWNSYFLQSEVIDPRMRIYGEKSIEYILRNNLWDSLFYMAKTDVWKPKEVWMAAHFSYNWEGFEKIMQLPERFSKYEDLHETLGWHLGWTLSNESMLSFLNKRELLKTKFQLNRNDMRRIIEGCISDLGLYIGGEYPNLSFDELFDPDVLQRSMLNYDTSCARFIIKHSNLKITDEMISRSPYPDRYKRVRRGWKDPPPRGPAFSLPRECTIS